MKHITGLLFIFLFAAALNAATVSNKRDMYYHGKLSRATTSAVVLNDKYVFDMEELHELSFQELPAVERDIPPIIKETEGRYRELNEMAEKIEKKYPGNEAVIIFSDGFYKLNKDGTWMSSYTIAVKLIKESAIDRFKSIADYFEEGRDIITVRKASVYFEDETVYPFQAVNFRTVSPQASEGFFAQASGVEYTFPILQAGAIIEYQVELKKEKPFRDDFFFPKWQIVNTYPVGSSKFSITVPAGKQLYYSAKNIDKNYKPEVKKSSATTEYVWQFKDIAPVFEEPFMPSLYSYMPSIKASLFDGWGPIYDWLAPLYEERTKPDELIKKKALELTRTAKNEDEKIAALYHYVQRSIRYSAVKMGISSTWAGYHANITYERKYGCCLDKALLLGAFLRAVGIKSSPVLLDTNDLQSHNMQTPDIDFAHVITKIKTGGRDLFLDSTTYDYRYPYMHPSNYGVEALSVGDRQIVNTGVPAKNDFYYDYEITISTPNSAFVVMRANFEGPIEGDRRSYLENLSYPKRVSVLNSFIGAISADAELLGNYLVNTGSLDRPFGFILEYMLGNYLIDAGDLAIFGLPDLEQRFPEISLKERKYPIEYPVPYAKRYRYIIKFPPGLKIEAMPENVKADSKHAFYSFACRHKEGEINCEARFVGKTRRIEAEDYDQYRAFLNKAIKHMREKIFFKRAEVK